MNWIQWYIDRDFTIKDSFYKDWDKKYAATDMLKYIEIIKLKPETLYIDSMTFPIRFSSLNAIDFAEHMIRVNNADLKYPIIIHRDWQIVDWYHRLVKAIIEKKKTIKAYRINVLGIPTKD